ncbi:hypothetical protein [Neisseria animalis]|uniref:Uncharacterized protein n=1 Tax=Neisseria animalis TaxID=492 RepID=A0A5P3MRF9_NEIAN|nr:hypothetical protein [Neisseria animalis]QEY24164.1 hypothetical protein D0T90_06395 [Neisseria animalis]ROW32230.1 hypothetical protein CGZ60_06600 [Neisseria animalis]VEE06417.1 secreted protein [Neisseria animalis]
MNTRRKMLAAAVLLLLFAAAKLLLLNQWQQQRAPNAQNAVCKVTQGCTLPNGVYVKFSSRIAAKEPFDIELRGVPDTVGEITVSFSMKDMDMGFNRYKLLPEGGGVWAARQIRLPLCVERRSDYLADLNIGGTVFQTAFTAE